MTQRGNGITGMYRSWINLINLDTRNLTWCGVLGVASGCNARSYLDQLRHKRRDREYITQYGNQARKSREIFSFQMCGAYVYLDIEKDRLCEKEHHWFNETCRLRNIKYRRFRLPQFLPQCIRRFERYTADIFSLLDEKEWKNKEGEVEKIQSCIMSLACDTNRMLMKIEKRSWHGTTDLCTFVPSLSFFIKKRDER